MTMKDYVRPCLLFSPWACFKKNLTTNYTHNSMLRDKRYNSNCHKFLVETRSRGPLHKTCAMRLRLRCVCMRSLSQIRPNCVSCRKHFASRPHIAFAVRMFRCRSWGAWLCTFVRRQRAWPIWKGCNHGLCIHVCVHFNRIRQYAHSSSGIDV